MLAPRSVQAPRCAVLIDFGSEDLEYLHRLLSRPGLSVRLVLDRSSSAAAGPIAATCGAPVSRDLADLTRQVFDLALLGSRADRCIELEFLLGAMGTPVRTVNEFLKEEEEDSLPIGQLGPEWLREPPAPPRPPMPARLRAAAAARRDHEASPHTPRRRRTDHAVLGPFPEFHDPKGIEEALARWSASIGASTAEVHGGDAEAIQWVCRSGPEDPLLTRLASLAFDLGIPQVVSRLDGEHAGSCSAAWPIRPREHRAVLAVSGVNPGAAHETWQRIARDLSRAWGERERPAGAEELERAQREAVHREPMRPESEQREPSRRVPARDESQHREPARHENARPEPGHHEPEHHEMPAPPEPAPARARGGWISSDSFMAAVVRSVGSASARFAVLRVTLEGSTDLMEPLGRMLLDRMSDAEAVCRPTPGSLALLLEGELVSPVQARRRVVALWHTCWQEQGRVLPAPPLAIEHVEHMEHSGSGEAAGVIYLVRRWLS